MPARIQITFDRHVATITFAHLPANVIDIAMMEELSTTIAEIEARGEVSLVLFRGEGKNFSAGVDIAIHTPERIGEMLTKFHAVIRAIARSKKVTAAIVHGTCLGGGAEIALACDIV